MDAFLIYILKTAVVMAVFYIFYRLLLSREKLHRLNRTVLLLTAAVSFVLPLCAISIQKTIPAGMADVAVGTGQLTAVTTSDEVGWITAFAVLYFAVAAFVLARLIVAVVATRRIIGSSKLVGEEDDCRIYVSDKAITPFSWMNDIVLPTEDFESGNHDIITHEKAHVAMHHSVDILFVDLVKAVQWFNPTIWMLRSDLAAIHEFQADEAVLGSGVDIRNYQYLLVRKSLGPVGYTIVNNFNHNILKNRINMMSKKKTSALMAWKALYAIPLVCLCLMANAKTVYVTEPQDIIVRIPDGKQPLFVVDGKKVSQEEFKKMDVSTIESITAIENATKAMELYGKDAKDGVVVVVTKNMAGIIKAAEPEPGKMDEVVVVGYGTADSGSMTETPEDYSIVDTKPLFNGGDAMEFAKYVCENMQYPKNCKDARIQGRILVSFTVSSAGKVKDVSILRGSGSDELDAEAVRIVGSSPDWTPAKKDGKNVPVTFTLPVTFHIR